MSVADIIHHLIEDTEASVDYSSAVSLLSGVSVESDLLAIAESYNWDEGLSVPRAIADHPVCDLGLALRLFELAEGVCWLEEPSLSNWEYQEEWANLCDTWAKRICSEHYQLGGTSFTSEYAKVQILKYKKLGIDPIFFTPL